MEHSLTNASFKNKLKQQLPKMIILLFVVQPLLDALSFWQEELGYSNTLSLALRFIMLVVTVLLGFYFSKRRPVYYVFATIFILFAIGHIYACIKAAGDNPAISPATMGTLLSDLTNQVRIFQLPLFTLCFISFLHANSANETAIKKGFVCNFILIAAIEIISVLSNTNPYTYEAKQIGICGWIVTPNAQSAIICMIIPIVLYAAYQSKKRFLFLLTAVLSAAMLFLFGTRLAYMGIFATLLGFSIVLLLSGNKAKSWHLAVLLLCVVICAGCLTRSPMYENQSQHQEILTERQADMDVLIAQGVAEYGQEDVRYLEAAYAKYCVGLVERFGIEAVAEKFNYSTDGSIVINARNWKSIYCSLLMQEMPFSSRLFGIELRNMSYQDYIYDMENDFPAIYYLCGAVGMFLLIVFLAYFIMLIIWALVKDARKYFTPQAGAYGIALLLGLAHAYFTSGVLRRPNASFYLSVILAIIYYLIRIKQYSETSANIQVKESNYEQIS